MSAPLYLRDCRLIVAGGSSEGLDLSLLRVQFSVKKSDAQSPNVANITVYGLADDTARQIQDEFTRVQLLAGYRGNIGQIFAGTIKQAVTGGSGTERYLKIAAADGDRAYNFAVVNATLAEGATQADQVNAAARSMQPYGVERGFTDDLGGTKNPRGRVMYGPAKKYLRDSAAATGTTWSVQDGSLQLVARTGVLPDQAIVLNSASGLLSAEQTDKGIKAHCLLNPMLRIGGKVQIDEALVERAQVQLGGSSATGAEPAKPADVNPDGLYRVLLVEYEGDNMQGPWFADLTTLSVDATAPAGTQVKKL